MPLKPQWGVFSEWDATYGGIIHLDVLGQPIVVLNSIKAAKDLLDKRPSIYSDRPILTMSGKLVGFANSFAMLHYGGWMAPAATHGLARIQPFQSTPIPQPIREGRRDACARPPQQAQFAFHRGHITCGRDYMPCHLWISSEDSNRRHMLHDPEVYPEPMKFKPERFAGSDEEMSRVGDLAFGFGRRACPGRYFADGTLFSVVATTLATCRVLPALDEHGNEVLPEYAYTSGTVSFPDNFGMRLERRSKQAAALLAEASVSVD